MRFHIRIIGAVILLLATTLWLPTQVVAEDGDEFSESEFLADIPLVYTASRLPQHPRDVAGAVTVIDREYIRSSNARSIAELFRTVPGFVVGISAGGRPVVAYHGLSGQLSQRIQVYVDGRSVYAPHLFGGVDWSLLNVPLDEVERIEIQRGANSVAYGANAFLGVIHIFTRSTAQSTGFGARIVAGSNGIADQHVRFGRSTGDSHWRTLAGRRSDNGLDGRRDHYATEYVDVRKEMQIGSGHEVSINAGFTRGQFGTGYPNRVANPARDEEMSSGYVHARQRYIVDSGNELQLAANLTFDEGKDKFYIPLLDGRKILIDGARQSRRFSLEYQQFKEFTPSLRGSWGVEYRGEYLQSHQYFNTDSVQTNSAWRMYSGNEWRLAPEWTINFGGLVERDRLAPTQFAGRFAINWKPGEIHTFKLGYSSAFRMPSLFEQRANWQITGGDQILDLRYLSSGDLEPEQIRVTDLVYSANLESLGLNFDARIFRERMTKLITGELVQVSNLSAQVQGLVAYDLRNNAKAYNDGYEFEIKWRPARGTQIVYNGYRARPKIDASSMLVDAIHKHSNSLMLNHAFSDSFQASASYTKTSSMRWLGEATNGSAQRIFTISLANSFRLAGSRVEVSGTLLRPIGQDHEFRELQKIPEQAWLSLAVEY